MKFVTYKSSAGSGKTHTLVKEYLRLVISNPEKYKNILAITFTNKAANEMKTRILEYLESLSVFDASTSGALIADIAAEMKEDLNLDEEQIRYRAGLVLSLILHNYTNFAVSTIDSFTHRLVRSFARDLRLPLNFEVGLDTEQLINKSIDLLIGKVGTDDSLTRVLVEFVETRLEDEQSWNIEKDLKSFAKTLLREDSMMAVEKLRNLEVKDFIGISARFREIIHSFEARLADPARKAVELIDSHHIQPASFYRGSSGLYSYFDRIAWKDFSRLQPNSYVEATISEGRWHAGKCPPDEAAAIDRIAPQLISFFNQIRQVIDQGYSEYALARLIHKNIYPIAVLNEIEKVMAEFRENENTVHISEFNKRIAAVVDREPIPFIYERIGEKYRHFLVDEFQDTSVLQWKNLLPLLENSLGSNHFNMIVGDGKQAIYRFRNGEVEQFAALPAIYGRSDDPVAIAREELLKAHYREVVLEKNYRSGAEIIRFNNRFFDYARRLLHEDLSGIYQDVAQEYDASKPGGLVHIEFLNKEERDKKEFLEFELEKILSLIRTDLQDFAHGEIAVLTRTGEQGSHVAAKLIRNGINVVSSEVLQLAASPEVGFLIAMLRHLNAPGDKIPAGEILTYLFERGKLKHQHLHTLMADVFPQEFSEGKLHTLLKIQGFDIQNLTGQNLTLPELVEALISTFNLDATGQDPFLQFFLDHALEFTITSNDDIPAFLDLWDEKLYKESIVIPETGQSVKVMTIHKAKGLQFPVVIYPFAGVDRHQLSNNKVWIEPNLKDFPNLSTALVNLTKDVEETTLAMYREKEIAKSFLDTLNVLYVTLTRPEQRIYIFTRDKTNKGKWNTASMFPDVADLLHGFLENSGLWNGPEEIYTFGQAEVLKSRYGSEKYHSAPLPSATYAGHWREKVRFRRLAPSMWDVENPDAKRERGKLLHYLMSQITSSENIPVVLERARNEGMLTDEDQPVFSGKITKLINHPRIAEYFRSGLRAFNEKDLLLKNGKTLRPDRLVIEGDACTIIDYKTGHAAESHKKQMLEYSQTLYEMGFQEVEALLVYLDEEEVVEVGSTNG